MNKQTHHSCNHLPMPFHILWNGPYWPPSTLPHRHSVPVQLDPTLDQVFTLRNEATTPNSLLNVIAALIPALGWSRWNEWRENMKDLFKGGDRYCHVSCWGRVHVYTQAGDYCFIPPNQEDIPLLNLSTVDALEMVPCLIVLINSKVNIFKLFPFWPFVFFLLWHVYLQCQSVFPIIYKSSSYTRIPLPCCKCFSACGLPFNCVFGRRCIF